MTPTEEAIRSFASKVYSETMGRGRIESITLDAVSWDRLSESAGGLQSYTAFPGGREERALMLAVVGGYVRVVRGG